MKTKPNVTPDLSIFEAFINTAQEEALAARQEREEYEDRDPISYLDTKNRTYRLRFRPEYVLDPKTGKPVRIILQRTVQSHRGFKGAGRMLCTGRDSCPVCHELERLREVKYDKLWELATRTEAIAPGYIYSATTPKDYKHLKLQTPTFIVMRKKASVSLQEFIADLSPADAHRALTPGVAAPMIKLFLSPGSDGTASWGFDLTEAELPPFPDDFKSVNDVYITEKNLPTDADLKAVRKHVNSILMSLGSGEMLDPEGGDSGETQGESESAARRANARAAASNALGKPIKPVPAASTACPGAAEGLEFGKNPQALNNEINATCLACPREEECILASTS